MPAHHITILGIDPGTTRIGFGVITSSRGVLRHVRSGILALNDYTEPHFHESRLVSIAQELTRLMSEVRPDRVSIERLFFSQNKKTALAVAEARGVIRYTVATRHIPIFELTPNEIKAAVTGNGSATKAAVAKMVSLLLSIPTKALLDDATDALAGAIAASQKLPPAY